MVSDILMKKKKDKTVISKCFEDIEKDKDLIEYYKNAKFFNDKDLSTHTDSLFGNVTKDELIEFKTTSLSMDISYEIFTKLKEIDSIKSICKKLNCNKAYIDNLRSGEQIISIEFIAEVLMVYKIDFEFKVGKNLW